MAEKNLRLTVSTPARTVLDAEVDFVLLRTVDGDMGVLRDHEPAAVLLDSGVLRAFRDKKTTDTLAVLGGFATIVDNRVTVLTDLAEPPDKLEAVVAAREKERADSKLQERRSDFETQRAEAALRHTLVQMDVSSYSIIKGHEENPE